MSNDESGFLANQLGNLLCSDHDYAIIVPEGEKAAAASCLG